jgi:hypothetical protein
MFEVASWPFREPGQPIVSVESIHELDRRFGTRGIGSRLPLHEPIALRA